jgi:ribosome-associated heat shock protein Hsp15
MVRHAEKNHVTVNGLVAKPSKEVFPTDKVTFRKDQITQIRFRHSRKPRRAKLVDMYR